jgi:hypothetical protein
MLGIEPLYLVAIAIGMLTLYILCYFVSQKLFKRSQCKLTKQSIISLLLILIFSVCVYFVSYHLITNKVLGNRFLHIFGGGFTLFIVVFLALKDAKIKLKSWVVLLIGFMVVTLLGLFNEVLEILIQKNIGFTLATSLDDTLLDLLSNNIGLVLAYLVSLRSKA